MRISAVIGTARALVRVMRKLRFLGVLMTGLTATRTSGLLPTLTEARGDFLAEHALHAVVVRLAAEEHGEVIALQRGQFF